MSTWPSRQLLAGVVVLMVAMSSATDLAGAQGVTSPRICEDPVLPTLPRAFGGGEVVLELTVDSDGAVSEIRPIRLTPPYLDFVAGAVKQWRFAPATAPINGNPTSIAAQVLVVAAFRPPTVYADPSPGPAAQVVGTPSPRVPSVGSLTLPAYPPTAIGDGVVVIEIAMHRGGLWNYRVVGAPSGFDAAALDAVRSWRFRTPEGSDVPDPLFTYAVVGFRALLTLPAERRR